MHEQEGTWRTLVKENVCAELPCVVQRLFDYIGGQNEPGVKINMTAPVVTKVEHGDGPFCKSNFTVSFFVPFAEQVTGASPYPIFSTETNAFGCSTMSIDLHANALHRSVYWDFALPSHSRNAQNTCIVLQICILYACADRVV